MAYSKYYITFKNHMLHFDADIEYVDILYKNIQNSPLPSDAIELFEGIDTERHPTISHYKVCETNHLMVIRHLKSTMYTSYIKDLYEELTLYLRGILQEMYENAKVEPERLVGEHSAKYSSQDILKHVRQGDISDFIIGNIFQALESEKSTIDLIKKTCNKTGIVVGEELVEKAVHYLEIRHKLVHTDGFADDDFKRSHQDLVYTERNYIVLTLTIIKKSKEAVFQLVEAMDSCAIRMHLLKSHICR